MSKLIHQEFRDWMQNLIAKHHTNISSIARRSGMPPSTLTKYMRANPRFTPSLSTMGKISDAFGEPIPDALLNAAGVSRKRPVRLAPAAQRGPTAEEIVQALRVLKAALAHL